MKIQIIFAATCFVFDREYSEGDRVPLETYEKLSLGDRKSLCRVVNCELTIHDLREILAQASTDLEGDDAHSVIDALQMAYGHLVDKVTTPSDETEVADESKVEEKIEATIPDKKQKQKSK